MSQQIFEQGFDTILELWSSLTQLTKPAYEVRIVSTYTICSGHIFSDVGLLIVCFVCLSYSLFGLWRLFVCFEIPTMLDATFPLHLAWRHVILHLRMLLLLPSLPLSPLLASALIWWLWLRNSSTLFFVAALQLLWIFQRRCNTGPIYFCYSSCLCISVYLSFYAAVVLAFLFFRALLKRVMPTKKSEGVGLVYYLT